MTTARLLTLLALSALAAHARSADDTLFHVYSRATPQSIVSRSLAGAGSAMPHDALQGLVNPALTAPTGAGSKHAYETGYGRDAIFDKLTLPFGALLFENNGAMGAYYRYLNGKHGSVHEAVVNFSGRIFDQTEPQGNGPVDFGMNFRYENSKWRHDAALPADDDADNTPEPAANTIEARGNSLLLDIGFYQKYLPGLDFSIVLSNLTGYRWSEADGRGKSNGWINGRHGIITVGMLYSLPIGGSVLLRVPIDVEMANVFAKSRPAAYMLRAGAETQIAQAYCARFGYARAPQNPTELITKFNYRNLFFGGVGAAVKGFLLDVFAGKDEFGATVTYKY